MAANVGQVPAYEALASTLAGDIEGITAQARLVVVHRWPDNTGAGFEPVYNPTPPANAHASTSEMNNYIKGLAILLKVLEGTLTEADTEVEGFWSILAGIPGAVGKIAGYDPETFVPDETP